MEKLANISTFENLQSQTGQVGLSPVEVFNAIDYTKMMDRSSGAAVARGGNWLNEDVDFMVDSFLNIPGVASKVMPDNHVQAKLQTGFVLEFIPPQSENWPWTAVIRKSPVETIMGEPAVGFRLEGFGAGEAAEFVKGFLGDYQSALNI